MKHRRNRKHSEFIEVSIQLKFNLTFRESDLDKLVTRAINEGIGDWCVISKATRRTGTKSTTYTLPFQVEDIETKKVYLVSREMILKSIGDTLIDYPHALDTEAGYNLIVDKLTQRNMDEIVQVAIFDKIQYGFVWE